MDTVTASLKTGSRVNGSDMFTPSNTTRVEGREIPLDYTPTQHATHMISAHSNSFDPGHAMCTEDL